jgi:NAD+ kinase
MKVGILGIRVKVKDAGIVDRLSNFLQAEGYEITLFKSSAEVADVDVVVVLGGDGAILHAATVASQKNIKVIGINYGTLGFLTEYEKEETERVKELLLQLKNNECDVLKRTMLEVQLDEKKYYALNEIALQRDYTHCNDQMAKLDIKVNGKEMDTLKGDGILVCTPTGSTAYSLSAGGAIMSPDVPAFMLTPICAFSLNARPVVFPDTDVFSVTVMGSGAMLLADGKQIACLSKGATLTIRKAPFTADFPLRGNSCFFRKIRTKLNQ